MQGTNESKAYERIIDDYNSLMRYVTISRLLCIQIDYFPPIQNANKASERQRENGVCTLVLIDPLDTNIVIDGLKATICYLETSDQKREDKAEKIHGKKEEWI